MQGIGQDSAATLATRQVTYYTLSALAAFPCPAGPREGENDMETYHMVQELAAQGVADVRQQLGHSSSMKLCCLSL